MTGTAENGGLTSMKRRVRFLPMILISLTFACSTPDRTNEKFTADAGQPVKGDWAIVRFEAEPENLNPVTSTSNVAHSALWGAMNSQVYELLLGYNTKDWDVTEPLLAEGPPTVSDDHLTYTITIRDGVKWHDGRPFTADDVLFSYKATACPQSDAAGIRSYLTDLADIEVEGRTLRFIMSKANVYNERNVVTNIMPIMPRHIFDEKGLLDGFTYKDIIGSKGKSDPKIKEFGNHFNSHPANRAPIGTGPYKFEKWDSGREIVLSRFEDYWGKKPYLDKIVYRIITDATAALAALKAGEIDLQPRLLPAQYKQQTSGPGFDEQFAKATYSIPARYQIIWNNERPFFRDKQVRQAMTMLVDRQKIIDTIRLGLGQVAVSAFFPQTKEFNSNLKALPFDPKRAAELLDQAGWKDHNGDGIRDKDGVKFKFEFLSSSSSTVLKQISSVLLEELRKAGIEMTERAVEFGLMQQTLKDHRFDASGLGFASDLVQDPFESWHSSSTAGGTNYQGFKNAESDRLLEQARLEFDNEKRQEIYWRWQELIHEEQPVTFLYYQVEPAAYSKRFQNAQWLPLRPGYDLTAWWVPKDRQKYKNGT
jgi:peptide/nickel transport system substrate-binding protein